MRKDILFLKLLKAVYHFNWPNNKQVLNDLITMIKENSTSDDVLLKFKAYINEYDSFHPYRYERKKLFLDAYVVAETENFKELNKLLNTLAPERKEPLSNLPYTILNGAFLAVKTVGEYIINHPVEFTVLALSTFAVAKTMANEADQTKDTLSVDTTASSHELASTNDNSISSTLSTSANLLQQMQCNAETGLCENSPVANANMPLCETSLPIGSYKLKYKCGNYMEKTYRSDPKLYKKDVAAVHELLEELIKEEPVVGCKIKEILATDERFHITLVDEKDLDSPLIRALYRGKDVSMMFRSGTTNNKANKHLTIHESHHAYIANRNLQQKRHYVPSLNVSHAYPFAMEELAVFDEALESGAGNLVVFLIVKKEKLDKGIPLSDKESALFEKFKAASAHYVPYEHKVVYSDPNFLSKLIKDGVLDHNHKMTSETFIFDQDFNVGTYKFTITMRVNAIEIENGRVVYKTDCLGDPSMKEYVSLLDGIIHFNKVVHSNSYANQRQKGNTYVNQQELDAHMHELYEPYPELFDLLWGKLRKYHMDQATETYKSCLKV